MALIARLPESKKILNPAVMLRTKQATARQIDKEFKGRQYFCPLCEGFREQIRNQSFGRHKELIETLDAFDFATRYRSASYDTDDSIKKYMHFAHSGLSELIKKLSGWENFHTGFNNEHDLAVLSFIELFQDETKYPEFKGCKVEKERYIKLDIPPIQRRPDIVIYRQENPIIAIEIQLSSLNFHEFKERTQNLQYITSQKVQWYIHQSIYSRMSNHRIWLSENGVEYFKFWEDKTTGVLQYEQGKPPDQKKHQRNQASTREKQGTCMLSTGLPSRREIEFEILKKQQKLLNPLISRKSIPELVVQNDSKTNANEEHFVLPQAEVVKSIYQKGDLVEVRGSRGIYQGVVVDFDEQGIPMVKDLKTDNIRNPFSLKYIRKIT